MNAILRPIPTRRQKMRAKEVFNFIIILSISIEPSHIILVILLLNAGGMPDRLNLLIWLPPEPAYIPPGGPYLWPLLHIVHLRTKILALLKQSFLSQRPFLCKICLPAQKSCTKSCTEILPLDLWQNGSYYKKWISMRERGHLRRCRWQDSLWVCSSKGSPLLWDYVLCSKF